MRRCVRDAARSRLHCCAHLVCSFALFGERNGTVVFHAAKQRKLLSAELTYGQAAFLLVLEWLFSFVAWSGLFDVVMVTATRL